MILTQSTIPFSSIVTYIYFFFASFWIDLTRKRVPSNEKSVLNTKNIVFSMDTIPGLLSTTSQITAQISLEHAQACPYDGVSERLHMIMRSSTCQVYVIVYCRHCFGVSYSHSSWSPPLKLAISILLKDMKLPPISSLRIYTSFPCPFQTVSEPKSLPLRNFIKYTLPHRPARSFSTTHIKLHQLTKTTMAANTNHSPSPSAPIASASIPPSAPGENYEPRQTHPSEDYTPDPSKSLPLSPVRQALVDDIIALYSCEPTIERVKRYTPDCVYDDQFVYANDRYKMAGQWFALPKLFKASKNERYQIVKDEPGLIQFRNEQVSKLPLFQPAPQNGYFVT